MEDRIQINGVWYIKEPEDAIPESETLDLTYFEGCVHETDKYCFEVTRIYRDYDANNFYSDNVDVKFTDKRTKPWKIDNWDSVDWLRGIYDTDMRAIGEALEVMDVNGVIELKALVGELIEMGWIKYYNCENINIGKPKSKTDHRIPGVGC